MLRENVKYESEHVAACLFKARKYVKSPGLFKQKLVFVVKERIRFNRGPRSAVVDVNPIDFRILLTKFIQKLPGSFLSVNFSDVDSLRRTVIVVNFLHSLLFEFAHFGGL